MTQPGALAGVVLAGGHGRRYGGPKAWARDPDGSLWLAGAVGALRRWCPAGVIVATRRGIGAPRVGADAVVFDDLADVGPLGGVLAGLDAAHRRHARRVLLLPVDLVQDAALAVTLGRLAGHPATLAVGASDCGGHRHHLLCRVAVEPTRAIIAARLARGRRAVRPVHERLGTVWLGSMPLVDRNLPG